MSPGVAFIDALLETLDEEQPEESTPASEPKRPAQKPVLKSAYRQSARETPVAPILSAMEKKSKTWCRLGAYWKRRSVSIEFFFDGAVMGIWAIASFAWGIEGGDLHGWRVCYSLLCVVGYLLLMLASGASKFRRRGERLRGRERLRAIYVRRGWEDP